VVLEGDSGSGSGSRSNYVLRVAQKLIFIERTTKCR